MEEVIAHFKETEKQTGGSGQFARVIIALEPLPADSEEEYMFEDKVTGGRVPREYIPSVDAGIKDAMQSGVLATVAATCERIATEMRALQKTDTLEAEEPFRKGQKGSSAMPHKRNPITAEKICGLSRVVKANAQVAFDNVALWHERDISHSSAERVAQADSFIALDHMLSKLEFLLDGMVLYPEQMMAKASASTRRPQHQQSQ